MCLKASLRGPIHNNGTYCICDLGSKITLNFAPLSVSFRLNLKYLRQKIGLFCFTRADLDHIKKAVVLQSCTHLWRGSLRALAVCSSGKQETCTIPHERILHLSEKRKTSCCICHLRLHLFLCSPAVPFGVTQSSSFTVFWFIRFWSEKI